MRWSFAGLGLLYAIIYAFLAFVAAGAGHGTGIFFVAIWSYGLGLLVFPLIGFLAADLRPFLVKVIFISILAIHYAVVVKLILVGWAGDFPHIEKMWNLSTWYILLPAGFYLVGQIVIWMVLIRRSIIYRERAA